MTGVTNEFRYTMSLILFYAINVINVFMCQSGQRYVHTLVRLLVCERKQTYELTTSVLMWTIWHDLSGHFWKQPPK